MVMQAVATLSLFLTSCLGMFAEEDQAADRWLRNVQSEIGRVASDNRSLADSILANVLVMFERDDAGLDVAVQQEDPAVVDRILAAMAEVQATQSRTEQAMVTLGRISDRSRSQRATYLVGAQLANQGNLGAADALLERLDDSPFKSRLLLKMVESMAIAEKFDDADSCAKQIGEPKLKEQAILFLTQAQSGSLPPLVRLAAPLQQKVRLLTLLSDPGRFDSAIEIVVAAQDNDRDRFERLVSESEEIAQATSSRVSSRLQLILALAMLEIQETARAQLVLDRLVEDVGLDALINSNSNGPLFSILVRADRVGWIEQILTMQRKAMRDPLSKTQYLTSLVEFGETLVVHDSVESFEVRLAPLEHAEERVFFQLGALRGCFEKGADACSSGVPSSQP